MQKTKVLTISMNADDRRLLDKLQRKLANIGSTAVIRLALRALEEKVK